MKGVYAANYLATLERHFSITLHQHFDLIAGTSTGGIIALGLAAGNTASQLVAFYKEHGPQIFPEGKAHKTRMGKLYRLVAEHLVRFRQGYWYEGDPLRSALTQTLKGERGVPLLMSDSLCRLIIPAVNAQNASPRVFKAHKGEPQVAHLTRDLTLKMTDVAMATAAAPWYLPIAKVDECGTDFTYIDGGLWANNPSVLAVTEALTYYVGNDKDYSHVELLSIGLPAGCGFTNDGRYRRGHKLIPQLLTYAMESSKTGADFTAGFLLREKPNLYHRVRPENLNEEQSERLGIDRANETAINELMMLGADQAHRDKNVDAVKILLTSP